jgi:hypothetical protein
MMKVTSPLHISMALLGIAIVILAVGEVMDVRSGHHFSLAPMSALMSAFVVILCAVAARKKR